MYNNTLEDLNAQFKVLSKSAKHNIMSEDSFIEDNVLYLFFNDSGIQKGGGPIKAPYRVIPITKLVQKINTLIGKNLTIEHNDYTVIGTVIDAGFHKDIITPSGKEIKANGLFVAKVQLNQNIPSNILLDKFSGVSSEISGQFLSEIISQWNGIDGEFEKILDFKEYSGITLTNNPRSSETGLKNSLNNDVMNDDLKKEIVEVIRNSLAGQQEDMLNYIKNEYKTQEDREKEIANMMEEVKGIQNSINNMKENADKIENMQKIINTVKEEMEEIKNMCSKIKNAQTVEVEKEEEKDKETIDNKITNSLNNFDFKF